MRCQDAGPQAAASPFLNPDSNSNPQQENKRCYCQLLPPTCLATPKCAKNLRTSVCRGEKNINYYFEREEKEQEVNLVASVFLFTHLDCEGRI